MLLTPHTFVGVAIAFLVPNPFIAFILSFIGHLLGDKIPHWDFYSNTKKEERTVGWRNLAVMGDMAFGVAIGVVFMSFSFWELNDPILTFSIFLCGVGSVLPDAISGIDLFLGKKNSLIHYVNKVQSAMQWQAPLPWGIISQLLVIIISLVLILNSIALL
jgi:hypothetical protein